MAEVNLLSFDNQRIDTLVFKRSSASVSTVLDDETVILNVETGEYSGLNEVGTVLWGTLEHEVTLKDMCDAVVANFSITLEGCSEDVQSFLKELAINKLIEVSVEANT